MYGMIPFNRRETNLFRFMDDIERNLFNPSISGKDQFRCDISEKDNAYLLSAELPGFDRKDIHVEVDGGMLTISASHNEEHEEKDEAGNFIRRERRYGSFSRSFNAEGIDVDGIKANYENGVLTLDLPKARVAEKQARSIEIGEAAPQKAKAVKAAKPAKPARAAKEHKAAPGVMGKNKGDVPRPQA